MGSERVEEPKGDPTSSGEVGEPKKELIGSDKVEESKREPKSSEEVGEPKRDSEPMLDPKSQLLT
jgi:hypothetical protein